MAISGAFGAGFVQGFGQSMQKNAEKRFEKQERYVDNMMENARRFAPKYAEDTATANATIDMMNEFQTRYSVSNEEFIALAQTYDVNKVYESIQIAERGLRDGQKLDVKGNILSALKIPEGAQLPEGMSAEDAVRGMVLGYAQNVNSNPNDNSETHKNRSWSKAISDVLALNPRASAEKQIEAMRVAGVPVQELLRYQAAAGGSYKPLENVTRTGTMDFSSDYKETDFEVSARAYTRTINSIVAGNEDIGAAEATSITAALEAMGVDNLEVLTQTTTQAGVVLADLELELANTGNSKLNRDRALSRLTAEINTGAEIKALMDSVESGRATALINKSYAEHGKLTDEYIRAILSNDEISDAADDVLPEDPIIPQDLSAPASALGSALTTPGGSVEPASSTITAEDDTSTPALDSLENPDLPRPANTREDGLRDNPLNNLRSQVYSTGPIEAFTNWMSGDDPEAEPGGDLLTKIKNNSDPAEEDVDAEPKEAPKEPANLQNFIISDEGRGLLSYLMIEEEFTSADSMEEFTDAVAAWFEENPKINVGAEVTAQKVASILRRAIQRLEQDN
jgi:hypothetical protein